MASALLTPILMLFMTSMIITDVTTFINLKLIKVEEVVVVQDIQKSCIVALSSDSMDLVNALDVKSWMVYAPIAADWEKYNKGDNHGELVNAKM